MAELALGLTKTVVEGTLSRIQLAIEEEKKLKEGVQQDLEFITGEFEMMQSFLKVANKERAKKNEVVRAWVRQLRDLAFDVEDWVEFVAHLEKDKSPCSCCWRLVPSCVVPPRDLDEATVEMKLLKARVHDLSQRSTRYNLFNSDDSGSSSGLDHKFVVPAGSDLSSIAFQVLRQVWKDESDRLRNVDSLQKLITSEVVGDDLQVIWVWENDDRYASQLIHRAYQDENICGSFQLQAWVKIMHPFNLQAFLNTLAAQLMFLGCSHHQATIDGLGSTAELIQQATNEQRYLVVLEHVSDFVEWNTIRKYLPDNKKGSRIVVSTQNLQNAVLCTRVPYLVSELRCFPEGRPSICAFYEKSTPQNDIDMDTLIEKIKRGGVISVYGGRWRESSLVKMVYYGIRNNYIRGVRFDHMRWVPVLYDGRHPFSLMDFLRCMLVDMHPYEFYDYGFKGLIDIIGGGYSFEGMFRLSDEDLIQRSRELLHNNGNCLVVIDGLQSTNDWDDLRKSTILPDDPTKCCIIVVTDDERVARHCVDDKEDLLVHISEEFQMGMRPIFPCGRETPVRWMRSICDPHLRKRRFVYDYSIAGCIGKGPAVVSVWGIAGIGKSTLVKWSYSKKMLDSAYCYFCWVDVPHPFSVGELCLRLLRSFFLDSILITYQNKEAAMIAILEGGRDPIEECRLLLKEYTQWLLVLDGLRSTDEWDTINDALCLSEHTDGSSTIVITNEQSIAMHCVNKKNEQVVVVQDLDADEALNLFNEKICIKNIDKESSDMEHVSKLSESIMNKCGGLPKLIDAVANHYMCSDNKRTYLKLKDINDNFMQILEGLHSLRGLLSWVQNYLETCKDDLKPCIFYLTVFPIGHYVRIRRMLWRFKAEGYIRGTEEKNTERLFNDLWQFSMFQMQQPSSKPEKCRLNGFLHEYVNSRPMVDNLVFALDSSCSMGSQPTGGQHLTIRDNWDRDKNVFWSTDVSRLRSLTVYGECRPFMFDPAKIKMRYLRVLDLEDASGVTNGVLENIIEVSPRLKFLSLRGCRDITRLPKSLGSLRQLQTLDVRDTRVATLPKAILKLQKLQYVRAGTIHSAPWDEGGIMAPYQVETREDIISTSIPVEDGTTFAAAPWAPAQDASVPSATASDSEDTTIFETPPLSPAEVATTFASAPSAPAEDASTPYATASDSEDTTIFETPQLPPAEVATAYAAAPSAAAGDASNPALTASDSEDTTIFETPSMSPIVAVARSALAEDVVKVGAAPIMAPAEDSSTAAAAPRSRTHALVPSWLSKLGCQSKSRLEYTIHGVKVPAGIGRLTTLHTFGVANVGPANKSDILNDLHMLTQLRRLSVCGINLDSIRQFFSAIAGLNHLNQLSVRMDKNRDGLFASLDITIPPPPKTLDECLKLLGHLRILPGSWIKDFAEVDKLQLEVTLQEQDDMQVILDHLKDRRYPSMKRLCIKPIQDGELRIGVNDEQFVDFHLDLAVLEIVCTTNLRASIGNINEVNVLKVHCSSGSSLQLSGLERIRSLEEVWLKGSCSNALKEDLQRQLDQRGDKAVLKVFQPHSS